MYERILQSGTGDRHGKQQDGPHNYHNTAFLGEPRCCLAQGPNHVALKTIGQNKDVNCNVRANKQNGYLISNRSVAALATVPRMSVHGALSV